MSTIDNTASGSAPAGASAATTTRSKPLGNAARAARGESRSGSRDAGRKPTTTIIVTAILAIVALYFLVPVYWVVVNATKSTEDLFSTSGFWFGENFQLWENLSSVLTANGGIFPRWGLNSLLYSGVGSVVATYFSVAAGYALAKYRFRGRELFFNIVLGGVLVPATALALPLFLLFSQVNMTNTFWAVLLPSIVSPFGVYLTRIFAASSVPDELLEASRLDGAGEVRTFFTVSVKLMTPALVTVFLFQFVTIWNNFFLPMIMLRSQELFPLTYGLYTWNTQLNQIPELRTYVLVGAFLSVVPLIAAFLMLQRFWQNGLGAGSVK